MEIIEVLLQCKKCGTPFVVKKMLQTKLDAEIEERKIRNRRNPVCMDCFKKEKVEESIRNAEKMGLPEVIGFTEKQIQFAFSLRNRYIEKHPNQIRLAAIELNAIQQDKVQPVMKARGYSSEEDCIADAFKKIGLYEAYLCLTEPNANRLILNLKEIT